MKLDEKDLRILSILMSDGRAKYTKIARMLSKVMNRNIPDTTVLFRIRKLQQTGVIKRFTTSIDPEKFGYTLCGVILARIGGHILHDISVEHARQIEDDLQKRPNVIFLALDNDETGIFALVLGKQKRDIEEIYIQLEDNPDVIDAQMWLIRQPTKGDSLIGTGLPITEIGGMSDV